MREGIDPDDLGVCLRVIAELDELPVEHPDAIVVQQAVARLFKTVKRRRKAERRAAVLAADRAVTSATATAAPGRSDDETQGLPRTSNTRGVRRRSLIQPLACYVCKDRY